VQQWEDDLPCAGRPRERDGRARGSARRAIAPRADTRPRTRARVPGVRPLLRLGTRVVWPLVQGFGH